MAEVLQSLHEEIQRQLEGASRSMEQKAKDAYLDTHAALYGLRAYGLGDFRVGFQGLYGWDSGKMGSGNVGFRVEGIKDAGTTLANCIRIV